MDQAALDEARAAFDRGDWVAAYDAWSVGRDDLSYTDLSYTDLDHLATAAELIGEHEAAVTALQRAFVVSQSDDDRHNSVTTAFRLSMISATHGAPATAAGWTARAEGLVPATDDGVEHGWVEFLRMYRALGQADFAAAHACAVDVTDVGRRHRHPDLTVLGLCAQGRMELYSGRISQGQALLDESMVRVLAGEASPIIAGHVFCTAIEGCQEIGDFARMAEWTAAMERWCAAQRGLLTFTGQCALHRGQLMRLRGEWSRALAEFALATQRYETVGASDAIGLAAYETGEVLRLTGDHDGADAAYERAADHGFDPQPGLALLWLARGQRAAAHGAVDRLLGEPAGPVQRVRLLPAAVEVLLAAGDVDRARAAAEELATLASDFGCAAVEAAAAHAAGAVDLTAGDARGAIPYLRKAQQLWARVADPYHQARARTHLGRALAEAGDRESSRRELEAARTALRRLGARPAAEEVSELLAPPQRPGGLTAREVEVLRLVASGRSNAQIAGALVLSEKTVARHLSNIFAKLDVGSRTAATAYAYEHELV